MRVAAVIILAVIMVALSYDKLHWNCFDTGIHGADGNYHPQRICEPRW